MLLTNLARELHALGRTREAIDLADRAAAEAARLGDAVVLQQGLLFGSGRIATPATSTAWRRCWRSSSARSAAASLLATSPLRPTGSERALLAQARGDLTGGGRGPSRSDC